VVNRLTSTEWQHPRFPRISYRQRRGRPCRFALVGLEDEHGDRAPEDKFEGVEDPVRFVTAISLEGADVLGQDHVSEED
jgi:hypothetical protein